MPIYCYKCFDCEHYEEVKQGIDDAPLSECPRCSGQFKRVIRNVGVIFKGSGFHVTDYKGNKTLTAKSDSTDKVEKSDSASVKESSEVSSSPSSGETKETKPASSAGASVDTK